MSIPSKANTQATRAEPGEVLYESASTRIVRVGEASAAGLAVFKHYLGAQAAQRLRNEADFLTRLAGIEGVAQQAQGAVAAEWADAARGAEVIVLRDVDGITLAQMLRIARFDLQTVLALATQLSRVLAEVHRRGVIHRDINPDNILVSPARQAVLIDFDLAVLAEQHLAVEPNGKIVGTLSYLAPEQTGRTGHAVDQRADLYSLGATLYEMATGRTPFEQADALQLIHDHLVREPVAPWQVDAGVPRALSNIILRLLAKAPEQRYQSAGGLLHDLLRLRGELEQQNTGIFELGERDFAARLAAPARLVARDPERAMLLNAFAEAMHAPLDAPLNTPLNVPPRAPLRTVLIGGPAGVGKSALINELRPAVTAAGGWFIYGKFDQYQKDGSTEGAVTQALRALGRLLLTQSEVKVAAQRHSILQSVGRHVALITRASNEFALLLGTHPDVPEVDPRQVELQFQQAMLDLLTAVVTPACPLVLVVDDLQWAGAYSLRTFERMMKDLALPGLLLVGSYRSEEVDANDVLAPMLARWQQQPQPPSQIALSNLTLAGMSEMIQHMLRLAPERSLALAQALNTLTGGNPFDTVEMINALRSDGVLNLAESGWLWDEMKVRRFIGRGNVVDLLAARISRLPPTSGELLEFMSCLGSAVECKLLCAAVGLTDGELRARLRAPLEDGLLVADETRGQDSVRFRHDRVQQAMLGAMDDAQRGRRQLAMARRLSRLPDFESEAAQQYLACVGMLDQPAEQLRATHLFYGLAQALASTATYILAERYLASAGGLLAAMDEPGESPLRRAIDVAQHRALYSLGRVNDADPLCARIEARTRDPLDLVEPTCLHTRFLDMQGRSREALALAVRLLAQLGLHVPPDFSDPRREQRIDALHEWVRQESQLDHSRRAQTQDRRLLGIYTVLARLGTSAFHCKDPYALPWAILEAQRLWVEHGPCAELLACMGSLGNMIIGERQDYLLGYTIGRHVIQVSQALGAEVRTAGMQLTFSWGPCIWLEPVENALAHVTRASEVFQAKGDDASFGSYFNIQKYIFLLEMAPNIQMCEAAIETGLVLCRRTGNIHSGALHTFEQQFLRALQGKTRAPDSFDDEQFNEQAFMARMGHFSHVQQARVFYGAFQSMIWGDLTALTRYAAAAGVSPTEPVDAAVYRTMHGYLFAALARAWELQQGEDSAADAAPLVAALESSRSWLARRAADQPYNFLHLLLLVEAEQAWALGDLWKAAATFDNAVLEAESRQRPWHRALITERAGLFQLAQGMTGTARYLLKKARDHYQAWGAQAKVDQMQRVHSFLQEPARSLVSQLDSPDDRSIKSSHQISPDVLDLVGVLRASQALSSETSLERLTARVSEVLASLSGATKVLVLSCNEGQWWMLSPALALASMPVAQAAELGLLPLSAFSYAERTGEALIVEDAAGDDRFARDPYFAGVPTCSLLLVPITSHGSTRAILLLENRLGRAAFNAQRLDAVMLIAGQLAVSLANAQNYESLEQRVQARTSELEQTQAQLVTTARRAGTAEIANNVLHNVGNVLNSINVSASALRTNISNSRIEGLTRAVALMNEHEHDLPRFIDTDPRGKALFPYLNQLVSALLAERKEAMNDLDRMSLSVNHITYVVSTQQAHAGPSRVQEMSQPHELIEEAVQLCAQAIEQSGIVVVRRYEDVPITALDRQRLVQILVNLIGNAAQAMERVPAAARQLTLTTGLASGDSDEDGEVGDKGKRIRITVQDAGEGITAQNLTRIFAHGFTTRMTGHGFGLHSSALAATEMGGKLTVHSDGPGCGAIFTIDLPLQ
jgi:predicted ATPase/signal transduction histidine kinase